MIWTSCHLSECTNSLLWEKFLSFLCENVCLFFDLLWTSTCSSFWRDVDFCVNVTGFASGNFFSKFAFKQNSFLDVSPFVALAASWSVRFDRRRVLVPQSDRQNFDWQAHRSALDASQVPETRLQGESFFQPYPLCWQGKICYRCLCLRRVVGSVVVVFVVLVEDPPQRRGARNVEAWALSKESGRWRYLA